MGFDHGFHAEHLFVARFKCGDEARLIDGLVIVLGQFGGLEGVVEGREVHARELVQFGGSCVHGFLGGFRAPKDGLCLVLDNFHEFLVLTHGVD